MNANQRWKDGLFDASGVDLIGIVIQNGVNVGRSTFTFICLYSVGERY